MDFGLTKNIRNLETVFNTRRWQGCWYIAGLSKRDNVLEGIWLKETGPFLLPTRGGERGRNYLETTTGSKKCIFILSVLVV